MTKFEEIDFRGFCRFGKNP